MIPSIMTKTNPVKKAKKAALKAKPAEKPQTPKGPKALASPAKAVADTKPKPSAQERANACVQEINEVLAKHRCVIIPYLDSPEPVGGTDPVRKIIVSASYGIQAEA